MEIQHAMTISWRECQVPKQATQLRIGSFVSGDELHVVERQRRTTVGGTGRRTGEFASGVGHRKAPYYRIVQ